MTKMGRPVRQASSKTVEYGEVDSEKEEEESDKVELEVDSAVEAEGNQAQAAKGKSNGSKKRKSREKSQGDDDDADGAVKKKERKSSKSSKKKSKDDSKKHKKEKKEKKEKMRTKKTNKVASDSEEDDAEAEVFDQDDDAAADDDDEEETPRKAADVKVAKRRGRPPKAKKRKAKDDSGESDIDEDEGEDEDEDEDDVFEDKLTKELQAVQADAADTPTLLKIEKMLAYDRKSKGEWLEFLSNYNTSKVVNGRRVELLHFEEEEEEDEEEDIPNAEGAAAASAAEGNAKAKDKKKKKKKKKKKLSKKKLRKIETRYCVKWLRESYIHVSWETAKSLKAYFGDSKLVDGKIRKLEASTAMMDSEEIQEMQKVDRIIDYNTFHEDEDDAEEEGEREGDGQRSGGKQGNKAVRASADDGQEPKSGTIRWEYQVKWKSQGYEDSTWELEEDIKARGNFEAAVAKFKHQDSEEFITSREKLGKKDPGYKSNQPFKGRVLRSYQVEAVDWLTFNHSKAHRGSILADEMGLGKTCQTVTFIHRLRHAEGVSGPFLVVAPLATLPHWQREFDAWTDLNAITYHGSADGREIVRKKEFYWNDGKRKAAGGMPRFDALVTNYETVLADVEYLRKFRWSLLVVDEAHRLKNRDSKLTTCLRESIRFGSSLLLTGTPIQNSLPELWTLLNFIAPQDFNSLDRFNTKYGAMTTAREMDDFHDQLRPYMLRRIKSEVEPLPDREDMLIEVELTILQKRFYRAIYEKNTEFLLMGVDKGARVSLNNVAMELRKCCCHPYLIDGVESKILSDNPVPKGAPREEYQAHIFNKLVESSGKLILLDKLLPKLKAEGHRVLIFSQMTRMLDILEDYLNFRQFLYERIDGSVRGVDRQFAIDRFSNQSSQAFAFLLSTRGCGQGINLTAADTVIMYDGDWNPQNDVQALARCHRIGQTKKVQVYRLITRKTYEQTMFQKASMKLGLDQAVMSGITSAEGELGGDKQHARQYKQGRSKKEQDLETERLLRYGAYALTEEGDADADSDALRFVESNIDEILQSRARKMDTVTEDNRLSKATFVSSVGEKNLDVDDPEFWTKVVGLKVQTEEEKELERSQRRGRNNNSKAEPTDSDLEDEVDLAGEEDEQAKTGDDIMGRKTWNRQSYLVLQAAVSCFGYRRLDKVWGYVNRKVPGRFTPEEVDDATRGLIAFCLLKAKSRTKPGTGANDDAASNASSGSSPQSGDSDDDSQASASGAVQNLRVSDFALVNMTRKALASRMLQVLDKTAIHAPVIRLQIIPDLLSGDPVKGFVIPDCLVSRQRTRADDTQDDAEFVDSDSDDSDLEGEARAAYRQLKRGPAFREEIATRVKSKGAKILRFVDKAYRLQAVEAMYKDPSTGLLRADKSFPVISGALPSPWWTKEDDAYLMFGLYETGWDPRKGGDTFTSLRPNEKLRFSRYPPVAPSAASVAAASVLTTPMTTGTPIADAVAKDGEDAVPKEDGEGAVSKEDGEDGEGAVPKEEARPVLAAPVLPPPAQGVATLHEAIAVASPVKDEASADGEDPAPSARAAGGGPVPLSRATSEVVQTGTEKADYWPSNHRLGLRAKRITDYFRMADAKREKAHFRRLKAADAKEARKEARDKLKTENPFTISSKRKKVSETSSSAPPAGDLPVSAPPRILSVVSAWSRTERRAAYRGLLRFGMPAEKPPPGLEPKYFPTYEPFLKACGLSRKSKEMLALHLKLFVQDALQLRIGMAISTRNADILISPMSAKKLLERVNTLRDLRSKVLVIGEDKLRQVLAREHRSLNNRRKSLMPAWWDLECDIALLKGAATHGIGSQNAQDAIRSDKTLTFYKVVSGQAHASERPSARNLKGPGRPAKYWDENEEDAEMDQDEEMEGDAAGTTDKADLDDSENVEGNGAPEVIDVEAADPASRNMFPPVVDIMGRLRALVEIVCRFYNQTSLSSLAAREDEAQKDVLLEPDIGEPSELPSPQAIQHVDDDKEGRDHKVPSRLPANLVVKAEGGVPAQLNLDEEDDVDNLADNKSKRKKDQGENESAGPPAKKVYAQSGLKQFFQPKSESPS